MAYPTNYLKENFNSIHAITHNNFNYNNLRSTIDCSKDANNHTKHYLHISNKSNNKNLMINKKYNNCILLSNKNSLYPIQYTTTQRQPQVSPSINLISKLLKEKNNNLLKYKKKIINNKVNPNTNKKNKKQDENININDYTKNALLESIKESNCDSTTINNNETNSEDFNYNDLLNEFNKNSNNKKGDIKKISQKHMKHYSDINGSINILKSAKNYNKKESMNNNNKKEINKIKFSKIYNSCIKKKNTQRIKYPKNNKNINVGCNKINNKSTQSNISSIISNNINQRRNNNKNLNMNLYIDKNDLINEIQNFELGFINNINNIFYNNEQNEELLESKIEKNILDQIINKNMNIKSKRLKRYEKSFVNNFNSDYSFESDGLKKSYGGPKISNYPINDNIFKDISFRSLTNSSDSFSLKKEINEKIDNNEIPGHKNYKWNMKNNDIILNSDNLLVDNFYLKNNYIQTDYNNYKKDIKRNISENILKKKEKIRKKKYIENNIYSILNNKKNKENINTTNNNISKDTSKRNKPKNKSNESGYKINKNKILNQKKFCFTNNEKTIKRNKLKISINDNTLGKILEKEKIKNEKVAHNNQFKNKIFKINKNVESRRRNINLILSCNSMNYSKYSMDKNTKSNNSSSVLKAKLKSKSTPKEHKKKNISLYGNNKNYNKIINKNSHAIYENSLITLPSVKKSSHTKKKKMVNKSCQKISNKLFIPAILININKNNDLNHKIKNKNGINKHKKLENLFGDYFEKLSINSCKMKNNSNISKNNNSIINLKNSLYQTISKTKSNSISMNKTKRIFKKYCNNISSFSSHINRKTKNNSTCAKKNIKTNIEVINKKNNVSNQFKKEN